MIYFKFKNFNFIVFVFFVFTFGANAETITIKTQNKNFEKNLKITDAAALDALTKSYQELLTLLNRHKETSIEPNLLFRAGENLRSQLNLLNRLMLNLSNLKEQDKVKKTSNDKALKAIEHYSRLINAYSDFSKIDLAFYFRAKTYEQINKKEKAKDDFLKIVQSYKNSSAYLPSLMALAQYEDERNEYEKEIEYLKKVVLEGDSQFFPHALYKMAWAYFNLKKIKESFSYLEENINYYYKKHTSKAALLNSTDLGLIESALLDIPTFYIEAIINNTLNLHKSIDYFNKIDSYKITKDKIFLKFAKLLRANELKNELIQFKDLMIEKENNNSITYEIILTTLEYFINKNNYDLVNLTTLDLLKLKNKNKIALTKELNYEIQKFLIQTSEKYQNLILKNLNATEIDKVKNAFLTLNQVFIEFLDSNDERIYEAHNNMAEILFALKSYQEATKEYFVLYKNIEKIKSKKIIKNEIPIKLINSRYQELLTEEKSFDALIAKSQKQNTDEIKNSKLQELIIWLDDNFAQNKSNETYLKFYYNSARIAYLNNNIKKAISMLKNVVEHSSDDEIKIASASLIIDTLIASENWNDLIIEIKSLNQKFTKKSDLVKKFFDKIVKIEVNTYLKLAKNAFDKGDYKTALTHAIECKKLNINLDDADNCTLIAGLSAYKANDTESSLKYFSEIINRKNNNQTLEQAYLERAKIYEKKFQYKNAVEDILSYLNLNPKITDKEKEKLIETISFESLYSNDFELIKKASKISKFSEQVFNVLNLENNKVETLLEELNQAENYIKTFFALKILEKNIEQLTEKQIKNIISIILKNHSSTHEIFSLSLLDTSNKAFALLIKKLRNEIKKNYPIKSKVNLIQARIKALQNTEKMIIDLLKIATIRSKAVLLNEVANIYLDFTDELKLFTEKQNSELSSDINNVILQFEEKAIQIREKAFEIALNNNIEKENLLEIFESYKKENPNKAKSIEAKLFKDDSINLLNSFNFNKNSTHNEEQIITYFNQAVKDKNFYLIQNLIQTANKINIDKNTTLIMQSKAFLLTGNQAEALELVKQISQYQFAKK
jgi:tetratricopeptide (TPR) repeat protein